MLCNKENMWSHIEQICNTKHNHTRTPARSQQTDVVCKQATALQNSKAPIYSEPHTGLLDPSIYVSAISDSSPEHPVQRRLIAANSSKGLIYDNCRVYTAEPFCVKVTMFRWCQVYVVTQPNGTNTNTTHAHNNNTQRRAWIGK